MERALISLMNENPLKRRDWPRVNEAPWSLVFYRFVVFGRFA